MGFSRKRQSILVGLAKVCAALAPNMQFYFYRIDRKVMTVKWSRALALLLWKEERGLLKGLVREVLEEWLCTALPNVKQTQAINQQNATNLN
jgi:hypothetical protein